MIHLFYCSNSMTAGELAGLQARLGADALQMLGLPCSGKITIPYLLKAFETGADGVIVCSCPQTQCKQLEGNLRASKRTEAVDELIEEIGLGKGRVLMVAKEQGQIEKVIDGIQNLQKELRMASRAEGPLASGSSAKVGRAAAAGARSRDRLGTAA